MLFGLEGYLTKWGLDLHSYHHGPNRFVVVKMESGCKRGILKFTQAPGYLTSNSDLLASSSATWVLSRGLFYHRCLSAIKTTNSIQNHIDRFLQNFVVIKFIPLRKTHFESTIVRPSPPLLAT